MHCGSWQSEMVVEKPMAPPVVDFGVTAYALPQSIMHLRELSLHVHAAGDVGCARKSISEPLR